MLTKPRQAAEHSNCSPAELVWRWRAAQHACRDRRQAQQRDQCRPRRPLQVLPRLAHVGCKSHEPSYSRMYPNFEHVARTRQSASRHIAGLYRRAAVEADLHVVGIDVAVNLGVAAREGLKFFRPAANRFLNTAGMEEDWAP